MPVALAIDELLYGVLRAQDLLKFAPILARESITKIDHLKDVTDDELGVVQLSDDQNIVPSPHPVRHEDVASTSSSSTQLALILKDDIKLMEGLGEGTFAVVKRALWQKSPTEKMDVAVKIIREVNEEVKKDLQAEINTMSKLRHPNLIQFYGVVLGDPMLMVMEFCDGGALLDRLRSSDKPVLLASQLLNYSVQIAAGMMHLEQKGYVHRDLATRNVLLTNNEQQVRICDFGLSRVVDETERLYILQGVKKVPFSWCPPESLRYRKFSSASDVWAFGVTLWELWTYGEEPWVGYGALQVLEATEKGERLRRPEKAPNNVFDMMYSCWMLKPTERPDFPKIYWVLSKIKFDIFQAKMDHVPTIPAHIHLKKGDRFIVLEEPSATTVHGQNVTSREYGHVLKNALESSQPFHQVQNFETIKPTRQAPSKPSANVQNDVNQALNFQSKTNQVSTFDAKVNQTSNFQPKVNHASSFNSKANPAPLPTSKPVVHGGTNRIEISSPIRNSIIHAGHGDGDLSRSWGEPGKIPEVYLKNAVLNPVVGTDVGRGISLVPTGNNIPIKPSIAKSPPMNSARSSSTVSSMMSSNNPLSASSTMSSTMSSGFGSRGGSIGSIEAWNRSTMSSMAKTGPVSFQNPQPNIPQHRRTENSDVIFRPENSTISQRPKTALELGSLQNIHSSQNLQSNNVPQAKKLSMNEQRKALQAFSWVSSELGTNKKFNEMAKKSEEVKNNGNTNFDFQNNGNSFGEIKKNENISIELQRNGNINREKKVENNAGQKDDNPNFPMTIGFPKKEEKENLQRNMNNGFIQGFPEIRNQQLGNVATTTAASSSTLSTLTLANTPIPSFSTGFSPKSSSGPDPFEVPAQARSLISRPLFTDYLGNKTTNNTPIPSASSSAILPNFLPMSSSALPPTLPLASSSNAPRPKMDPTPMFKPFHTLGPASSKQLGQEILRELESRNGQIQATPQQVAQVYPGLDELMKGSQNPQMKKVNTADPISLLPPPSPLFQSLSGTKNQPTTVNSNPTMRPRPNSTILNGSMNHNSKPPLSVLEPTPLFVKPTVIPGTAPPSNGAVINNLISTLTTPSHLKTQSFATSERNKLLDSVQKEMPTAEVNQCKYALLKHNFDVSMAVKDLKVQYLINTMKLTNDADCAASALDSCGWDLQRAVDRLLS
ncbi:hypothetical protein FO519_001230 [Halicephalobus sp. NKZ332]|nr:hypothetical protein FO519_001230 [Halicephalobus sp. NKZ332]